MLLVEMLLKKCFSLNFKNISKKMYLCFRAFRFQNDDIVKCLTPNSTKVCFLTGRNS